METITAGIPELDHCPILTRLKAFIVPQGIVARLQHVFRDRQGAVLDLSEFVPAGDSISAVDPDEGAVELRIKEFLGGGESSSQNPLWRLDGALGDATRGEVVAELSSDITDKPGIYELSWGLRDAQGDLVLVNQALLSVERSLFGDRTWNRRHPGAPTINEIRMWMMDSSPAENLLLDDIEFGDEQICLALTRPVQKWNESPPPIEIYNTRTFPFRGAWASGTLAELYKMAGAHYRRNRLGTQAGGITIDDKNKEREYMTEGQRLQEEYDTWLLNKKVEINLKKFAGLSASPYSGIGGW